MDPKVSIQIEKWPFTRVPSAMHDNLKCRGGGVLTLADIGCYSFLVLWGQRDGRVWVLRENLAKALGIGRKTLYRHLERLEAAGWLRYEDPVVAGSKTRTIVLTGVDGPLPSAVVQPTDGSNLTHAPDPTNGSNLTRGMGQICPMNGSNLPPISTRSKDDEEKYSNADAFVDSEVTASSEKKNEGSKKRKKGSKKKASSGKKNSTLPPPPSFGANGTTVSALAHVSPGHAPEALPAAARAAEPPTWPPRSSADVYKAWVYEISLKHPDARVSPRSGAKENSIIKTLLGKYDADTLRDMIRVAVWDWSAIRETIDVWYTKDKEIPEVTAISKLAAQLATKLKSGVTSARRRVSEYRSRYVLKEPPKRVRKPGELTKAQAFRKAQGIPHLEF